MIKQIVTSLVVIACSSMAFGELPQFTSYAALRVHGKYEKKIKDADIQYYRDLEAAKKSAMKAGELEEANLI